jgi:hypothetical protein
MFEPKPTKLQVSSTTLLRWIRDHSGENFEPSMVVIANDWTTKIVWAQLDTLCLCPPFLDTPEPPPSRALIQRPQGLSFIHCYPICSPLPMDGSIRRYGLTARGQYYLEARENPEAAHGTYLRMALKHPEIVSPEALAILKAVPAWKKALAHLSVVRVMLQNEWGRTTQAWSWRNFIWGTLLKLILLGGGIGGVVGLIWLLVRTMASK